MCAEIQTARINVLLISLLASLFIEIIAFENDIVQLVVNEKKVDGKTFVELICTSTMEPFPSVGVFYFNNVSLANISPFNGTCYSSHHECQSLQCECGLKYFNYNHTLAMNITQAIFTCELRFNIEKGGQKKNVAVRDSVFYNSSGKLFQELNKTISEHSRYFFKHDHIPKIYSF